jgi:hypothetical protein
MEPIIKKQWFIDSKKGNIKDEYYFEKKLGSGGYGAVYLAKNKKTGRFYFSFIRVSMRCESNLESKDSGLRKLS